MTRESEKSKIRMSVIVDGKHINSLKKADEVIDQIFDYFGEQLQDKDDEIELLKCRVEELIKPKTCEGCSNFLYKDGNHYPFCLEHWFYFISKNMEKVLNCNKYDPKDNA